MEEQQVIMRTPKQVLDSIHTVLKEVGGDQFFSSPSEQMQRHRESFSAMFFLVAMKKAFGFDWWLCQTNERFPDFTAFAFKHELDSDGTPIILGEQCEHVEIPSSCKTAFEALQIVQKKFTKNYDNPGKINLIIYINHAQSENWIRFLADHIIRKDYFQSVWTIHLKFSSPDIIKRAIIHKLRPEPMIWSYADVDEPGLFFNEFREDIFETLPNNDKYFTLKKNFRDAIRKKAIRGRLSKFDNRPESK